MRLLDSIKFLKYKVILYTKYNILNTNFMCGRFSITSDIEELHERFGVEVGK